MLTLMIFRHAKSSWDDASLADFDRPLAPRGMKAAGAMARHMQETLAPPNRIVCSPAQRARETLAHLLPALNGEININLDQALYDLGSPRALLKHIKEMGISEDRLMLVGHNPLLETLATLLIGSGTESDREALETKFPTAALAVIEFDAKDWSDVEPESGRLVKFILPLFDVQQHRMPDLRREEERKA